MIRLAVMMYARDPLALRKMVDLLHGGDRHLPPDGAVLVEPLWPVVRWRYPQEAGEDLKFQLLALLGWTAPLRHRGAELRSFQISGEETARESD